MKNSVYEDNKYCMQDVGNVYIGTKYTFEELLAADEIPFKFRLIVEQHMLSEADREDTLETQLYYLDGKKFAVQIYKQLKARVKVNLIEEHRGLFGKTEKKYITRTLPIEELVAMPVAEKEEKGVVVQELMLGKLALMAF